jgi:hypothetical protein
LGVHDIYTILVFDDFEQLIAIMRIADVTRVTGYATAYVTGYVG